MIRGVILARFHLAKFCPINNPYFTKQNLAAVNSCPSRLVLAACVHGDRAPVLHPIPDFSEVEFPKDRRRLRVLEKQPTLPAGKRPPKMQKQLRFLRGPEQVHNKLIHKQYGIRANQGGTMKHGHIEMVRNGINRKLDERTMFAIWRIEPLWKPMTKKGQGHRMGKGKGAIDHYVTPIKEGRIIIEVGGNCEYEEVLPFLKRVAAKLPFKAEAVSQEILDAEAEEAERVGRLNVNPFSYEYCMKNNFMGCRKWASPYDYIWHGKYR